MKTIKILIVVLSVSAISMAQDVPPYTLSEAEVTPPKFEENLEFKSISSIQQYIAKNIDYSEFAGLQYEGIEVIEFVVGTDGELSNFKIINKVSSEIEEHIIQLLKTTKNMWAPGQINGVPVAMHQEVALKIKPNGHAFKRNDHNFNTIAQIYFDKGVKKLVVKNNAKQALNNFESAIRYKPYDQSLLMLRALCKLELGEVESAQEDLARIKKLCGSSTELVVMAQNILPFYKANETHIQLMAIQ